MRKTFWRGGIAAVLGLVGSFQSAHAADKPWEQILHPRPAAMPPPRAGLETSIQLPTHRKEVAQTRVKWETDLNVALALAKAENRPVFVTFRCLPCKSCSEFDRTVLEGGPDLNPLFQQFVTVRLLSTKDVDMRLLPMAQFQDLDVSWWSYFLSPEGKIYGVFGGRDKSGDATRTSKETLISTMKRILAHHYDARRPAWDVDGPLPETTGKPQTPADLPGYKNWLTVRQNAKHVQDHNCIHCHQTVEIMRQGQLDLKQFDKQRDTQVWPYPENVGVTLDLHDGLKVKQVIAGSPAAVAGIKAGDILGAADGRRLFSQADFRAVLHRTAISGPTKVDVVYAREGTIRSAELSLADGWRKTDLSWRTSIADGNLGAWAGFWPTDGGNQRDRLGVPKDKMAVKPHLGFNTATGPAAAAGLKTSDIITAVNGESPNLINREFNVWFRMKFEPGDEVTLTVKGQDGAERQVKYKPTR